VGLRILDTKDFPPAHFPYLHSDQLALNQDPKSHRPIAPQTPAFQPPQLLVKSGWKRESGRFQARVLSEQDRPTLCTELYVSVHFPTDRKNDLEAACLVYNSKLASYFLLHTSSRFASFIQEVNVEDLLRVPLPPTRVTLDSIRSPKDTDEKVRRAFDLKTPEWTLVEDAFDYTMSAFRSAKKLAKATAHGTTASTPGEVADADLLRQYGDAFAQVIRAGFGEDKRLRMTVFRTPADLQCPVHLVAIHLGLDENDHGQIVEFEDVATEALLARIVTLSNVLDRRSPDGKTLCRRVARVYDNMKVHQTEVPTMYLCKPNLARYWTRSMAMRDADEVAVDLRLLAQAKGSRPRRKAARA
jgi:hypothetical protein